MTSWADDLEIYIGSNQSGEEFLPNVMFIMDTSGSMSNLDEGSESRLLRVQNALKEVLGKATNINAGLMRFSNIGGPVLYPVTNLDEGVSTDLVYAVNRNQDDAHEIDGIVTTNSETVTITQRRKKVYSGFRFDNVRIPKNARITRAYMRLFSQGLDDKSANISIHGELSPNSASFSTTRNNISSRKLTSPAIWSLGTHFPVKDELVTTPDISLVIQNVVDQESWCGGNALSLILSSSALTNEGLKQAQALDNGSGLTPQLVINYDSKSSTGCMAGEDVYQVQSQNNNVEERNDGTDNTGAILNMQASQNQSIGVRFQNVLIPKNATIKSAKLVLTAERDSDSSAASMKIQGIAQDNPIDYSSHITNQLERAPKTSAVTMSMPRFETNEEYDSPDVSALVQEIVDRDGWEPGNAMAFAFSNFSGAREAYTFNGDAGRAVRFEVEFEGDAIPGSSQTVRDRLSSIVDELSAVGTTPIVDTLYEAVTYFSGNEVDFGLTRANDSVGGASIRNFTRVSSELSYIGESPVRPAGCTEDNLSSSNCRTEFIPAGAKYISPITNLQCQTNNHIVLLSDGRANGNVSQNRIKTLLGTSECLAGTSADEECGLDLVRNIADASTSVVGTSVTTHTIGFAANSEAENYLNQLAIQSGGSFFTADSSEKLIEAFNSIIQSAKDVSATFVSPGVAVNQLNRLTHRDELYYAVFEPDEGKIWPGNLKRYRIANNTVLDAAEKPAIDSTSGFFKDSAQSFWSLAPDGANVGAGGAASLLTASRNLYVAGESSLIVSASNELHERNSSLTAEMLGVAGEPNSEELRDVILQWARGVDVRDQDGDGDITDVRLSIGDPIHSQPAVVDYSEDETAIFVATNQGYLHSFDAQTGDENFAIVPQQLLPNLQDFYFNQDTINHTYGLDGDLVLRTNGNKRYLYVGMRRGGSTYFAFDISDSKRPSLMFTINNGDTGLEKLGQTWSAPVITKIRTGGTVRNVMIVGGGYDESQDNKVIRSPDTVGNAIYMFDADSGSLIWSASNSGSSLVVPEMEYSIPGRVSVVDRNNDGFADHMYASDMGGQLFRFDIYNDRTGSDFIKGARIADFGGNTEQDNRRFYYGPDIAQIAIGSDLYYAVAIGSGKRASPLDRVIEDRFYMLRDQSAFNINESGLFSFPEVATESDLYDASLGLLASTDSGVVSVESAEFASKSGWLLDFNVSGEKVLASPLIIDHNIFFSTYIPAESDPSECAPATGRSRAYLVNLLNANAVNFIEIPKDETDNVNSRFAETTLSGIPPSPTFNVADDGNISICLGTVCSRTQPDVDDDGTFESCVEGLGCLTENIFAEKERVRKGSWRTETESR
jgi:type IV pilus assembly protein PilY1